MSGTQDWTGVTASATATLAQGSTLTAGHQLVLNLSAVTQTTRSLLFLLANDQAGPGPAILQSAMVRGSNSGIRWISSTNLLSDLGSISTLSGDGWAPIYVPFYGLVDSAATATFTFDADYTIHYWVLELPDADLLGSPLLPVMVGSPPYPALEATQQARTFVGVPTGDTFPVVATPATGLKSASSSINVAGNIVTNVQLLAAPAAGKQRVIDYVYSNCSGSVFFGYNGANPAAAPVLIPNGTPVYLGARLTGTLQYTIQTAAGGNLYVAYHDEAA